jgi:hypothetical protein
VSPKRQLAIGLAIVIACTLLAGVAAFEALTSPPTITSWTCRLPAEGSNQWRCAYETMSNPDRIPLWILTVIFCFPGALLIVTYLQRKDRKEGAA